MIASEPGLDGHRFSNRVKWRSDSSARSSSLKKWLTLPTFVRDAWFQQQTRAYRGNTAIQPDALHTIAVAMTSFVWNCQSYSFVCSPSGACGSWPLSFLRLRLNLTQWCCRFGRSGCSGSRFHPSGFASTPHWKEKLFLHRTCRRLEAPDTRQSTFCVVQTAASSNMSRERLPILCREVCPSELTW